MTETKINKNMLEEKREYNTKKTEVLLNELVERSKLTENRKIKRSDSDNLILNIDVKDFKNEYIGNPFISEIKINNEKQTVSLKVFKSSVVTFISNVYDVNLKVLKEQSIKKGGFVGLCEYDNLLKEYVKEQSNNYLKVIS
jgi:hypothetical protein